MACLVGESFRPARQTISSDSFAKRISNIEQKTRLSNRFINKLLYAEDRKSREKFLVDCGAAISLLPRRFIKNRSVQKNVVEKKLYAANGSSIETFGSLNLELDFGLRRVFSWQFVIADVQFPIVGADFLHHNDLLIDLRRAKLIDGRTLVNRQLDSVRSKNISTIQTRVNFEPPNEYERLLKNQYPALLLPFDLSEIKSVPQHDTVHRIVTTGRPPYHRARPLRPEILKSAKDEFDSLLSTKIIQRSNSEYASPLHMVKKANGEWRPTGDFRSLNAQTTPDRYPLPNLRSFSDQLYGACIFSKIDLRKGFYHIPVADVDIKKTAVITPFGLFESLRMPFGLRNAPQSFQRFMDKTLNGLPRVFCYVDDILIASSSKDQHLQDLKSLFDRLNKYRLHINAEKTELGKANLTFLGHFISSKGISPPKERIEAIKAFEKPTSKKQLQRFIGMVNFYHRFYPKMAERLSPLYEILKTDSKSITWTEAASKAFQQLKDDLHTHIVLQFPSPRGDVRVCTDASGIAVGGTIEQQLDDGSWVPLGLYSKKLSKSQVNYSTFDRELLAIKLVIKHFEHFLVGQQFHVLTDHKPLLHVMKSQASRSPLQSRCLSYISQFTTDIRYISGENNVVADALSRHADTVHSINAQPDYESWQKDLQNDEEISELIGSKHSGLKLQQLLVPGCTKKIWCDSSTGTIRPLVPKASRSEIIDAYHKLAHPGIKSTLKLVSHRYVWPRMADDVRALVKNCTTCGRAKTIRHIKSPFGSFSDVKQRFEWVHVDIVGPLPLCNGFRYLFTAIDRFTRWPEAIPVANIDETTIANAFVSGWISRFGVPSNVTSDRGKQFISKLADRFSKVFGYHRITTSAYHPAANGLVERFHRTLKSSLIALIDKHKCTWIDALPLVLLSIRSTIKESINRSSAELVYGMQLSLPPDLTLFNEWPQHDNSFIKSTADQLSDVMRSISTFRSQNRQNINDCYLPKSLLEATHCFVKNENRKALQTFYDGPYQILHRAEKFYRIMMPWGEDSISIDRIKPAPIEGSSAGESSWRGGMCDHTYAQQPTRQRISHQPIPDKPSLDSRSETD